MAREAVITILSWRYFSVVWITDCGHWAMQMALRNQALSKFRFYDASLICPPHPVPLEKEDCVIVIC